ncbi:MAG TPA: choice-of-anchor Q domain-containing protein [Verrucomicrobiota bacterium]|nr:choice-of-anchor Q domain-containing protein [Verrucomicrobiota bacterium]
MNRSLRRLSLAACLGCLPVVCTPATFYVAPPPQGDDAHPGTDAQPFARIQRGIDAAQTGDTVVLEQGTYLETVRFRGKDLVLRSTDPFDPTVVSRTVVDGNGARLVVVFDGIETAACVIEGLTLTRGSLIGSDALGAGISGGTAHQRTRATLRNNRILANLEVGIAYCDGLIEGNTISDNTSWRSAGGLAYCNAWIGFNLIVGNRSRCDGGGGLAGCGGSMVGNLIVANITDGSGGGLSDCDGLLQNNTVADNRANGPSGGGMVQCSGPIENGIVWSNAPQGGPQLVECSVPTYSCIQNWTEGGQGNITADPLFANGLGGDYRLLPGSPCVDAGEPGGLWLPERDLAGTHRVLYGGRRFAVDMGAYEFSIARCEVAADRRYATLTWSSRNGAYYSISWSTDLETWYSAAAVRSTSDLTTTWIDDGSMTGGSPATVPWRFYRITK